MDQTVGNGPDSLVLGISQDAYRGNAQYTIRVDGTQIGGTLTAESLHSAGQSDTTTVRGDWGVGNHTASVNFLNDEWGGTAATDRNLYVDGATYNGAGVDGAAKTLLRGGPASFGFTEAGASSSSPPPSGPASATVGSGSDTLALRISQDAYQGSAQYTVKVDGTQIGGVQTAQAAHGGEPDTLTVKGDWGAGSHRVEVQFLNDAYGGSASADRNLYVDGATYNGASVSGSTQTLLWSGVAGFSFTEGSAPGAGTGSGGTTPPPPPPPSNDLPAHTVVRHESFDNGTGIFTGRWGDVSTGNGEATMTSHYGVWEDSGLITRELYGYGLYEGTLKTNTGGIGGYVNLWPSSWPGPEIDVFETFASKQEYATVHWNDNGNNAYYSINLPNVDSSQPHTYAVNWQRDFLDFYVDGRFAGRGTEHVPRSAADGGENLAFSFGTQTWWNTQHQTGDFRLTAYDFTYSTIA